MKESFSYRWFKILGSVGYGLNDFKNIEKSAAPELGYTYKND